jgi:hypothetical protein
MRRLVLGLLLCLLPACRSCLETEGYVIVARGGSGGTGASGSGASGGGPPDCDPNAPAGGIVFASVPALGEGSEGPPGCESGGISDGLEVFALDPESGECLARAGATGSARTSARVLHALDSRTFIGGVLASGSLALPASCVDRAPVELPTLDAAETVFLGALELEGDALCTAWASRAAGEAGAATLDAITREGTGVAIAGSLPGACALFEGDSRPAGAFVARYDAAGARVDHVAFASSAGDRVLGVAGDLATGTVLAEGAACHGCEGRTLVDPAASTCGPPAARCGGGGAGGTGGAGGSGGTAGAGGLGGGGAGGGGGAPAVDAQNALLWTSARSGACSGFDTYGADGAGLAQIGYGVASEITTDGSCRSYWTGSAGTSSFRFDDAVAGAELAAGQGSDGDGFLAMFQGNDCGEAAGFLWSIRLDALAGGRAWGNRVLPIECDSAIVVTAIVEGATELALTRCTRDGGCVEDSERIGLAAANPQLVVLRFGASGALEWYGAIGPIDTGAVLAAGGTREPLDHVSVDRLGNVYLTWRSTVPLFTRNIERASCPDLDSPGTSLVRLGRERAAGSEDPVGQAACEWAVRLLP